MSEVPRPGLVFLLGLERATAALGFVVDEIGRTIVQLRAEWFPTQITFTIIKPPILL